MTSSALEANADTLLEIVVMSEGEVQASSTLFALAVPTLFGAASAIVAEPLGPTYRAELNRIESDIHKIGGIDAVDEAIISIAMRDPAHADWRAVVLEGTWSNIGREVE